MSDREVSVGGRFRMSRRRLLVTAGAAATGAALLGSPNAQADEVVKRDTEPVQGDWRYCQKCEALFFDGYAGKGICAAGGGHEAAGYYFVLAHDAPLPGQPDWRFCQKCEALFFDGYAGKGICAAGGGHQAAGYNFVLAHDVLGPGQPDWRFCQKCQALFFNGYTGKGVCAAGDGHQAAGYNFLLYYER